MPGLGRIVYLDGLTSTGKTSIVREIQARDARLFYALGFDLFEETIPPWAADDERRYAEAIIAMYHAARAFSDQGGDVLIDGLIFRMKGLERHYETLLSIFEGYPLYIVNVHCPMDILRERSIARGDRRAEQHVTQSRLREGGIAYSLSIDTSVNDVKRCADILLERFG